MVHDEFAVSGPDVIDGLQVGADESGEHSRAHHGSVLEAVTVAGEADINVTSGFFEHNLRGSLHEPDNPLEDGVGELRFVGNEEEEAVHADQLARRLEEPSPRPVEYGMLLTLRAVFGVLVLVPHVRGWPLPVGFDLHHGLHMNQRVIERVADIAVAAAGNGEVTGCPALLVEQRETDPLWFPITKVHMQLLHQGKVIRHLEIISPPGIHLRLSTEVDREPVHCLKPVVPQHPFL